MGDGTETGRASGAKLSRRPAEHDLVDEVFGDLRVVWPMERSATKQKARYHVRCACGWAGPMLRDRIVNGGLCPSCASIVQRFFGSALGRSMIDLYPAETLARWWAHRAAAVTAEQIRAELRGDAGLDGVEEDPPRVVLVREAPTTCALCGAVLAPSKTKPRRYCSSRCKDLVAHAAHKARKKEKTT
jgi:hypothetical protein